jgi:glycosyltransferase involved in cell wall biosynthesis
VTLSETSEYRPGCSVVICTRGRPEPLEQCLRALREQRYPSFEVLVVDNAPTDTHTRELAERFGVMYALDPVPGLSHARNLAARICETELIAYLDDDAQPDPDWLGALAREFEDPEVLAVVGQCRPMGEETEIERLWVMEFGEVIGAKERLSIDRRSSDWFEYANFGGIGGGGNMAFRRRAFELWPGFDERLGRGMPLDGGEENFAFFSLLHRGYKVIATPAAVVHHACPPTLAALRARKLKNRATAVGYLFMLLVEAKGYRLATLRYILRKLCGRVPPFGQGKSPGNLVPRWRLFIAQLQGPWLYLQSSIMPRSSARVLCSRLSSC